ncbi:Alpha/Beta hydrolase protein [Gorgonomyces haynaldii]|nr:Alpha/Beta hydrolase protein [Gorgonomyces haynaldii]
MLQKLLPTTLPNWSFKMKITVPLYRQALHRYRNSVQGARRALELVQTTMPSQLQLETEQIPPTNRTIGGISSGHTLTCEVISTLKTNSRTVLYFHGGAYIMSNPKLHRNMTCQLSLLSQCRVVVPEYRKAPDNPYPSALLDAVSTYLYLIDQQDPESIILCGDSAGGGLALSLALYLRDHDLPLPAGIAVMSPWLDLTHSLPSFALHSYDWLPPKSQDPQWIIPGRRSQYYTLSDAMNTHPYVSPLFATENKKPLPPTLIQVGDQERLRDESIVFACSRFPQTSLQLYEDQVHVFQTFASYGEKQSIHAFESIANFVNDPKSLGVSAVDRDCNTTEIPREQLLQRVQQGKRLVEKRAQEQCFKKAMVLPRLPNLALYRC